MTHEDRIAGCLVCDQESSEPDDRVFVDEIWRCGILPGYEVSGWVVLSLRRHAELITSLTDTEAASFGSRLRDLSAAICIATGAPKVYAVTFGEAWPHFHVLLTPRTDEVPTDRRAGDILKLRTEWNDLLAARALVPAIRSAYEAIVGGQ